MEAAQGVYALPWEQAQGPDPDFADRLHAARPALLSVRRTLMRGKPSNNPDRDAKQFVPWRTARDELAGNYSDTASLFNYEGINDPQIFASDWS